MVLKPLAVSLADIDSHIIYYVTRSGFPACKNELLAPFSESFRNYSLFEPTAYTTITWRLEQSYGSSVAELVLVGHIILIIYKLWLTYAAGVTMNIFLK